MKEILLEFENGHIYRTIIMERINIKYQINKPLCTVYSYILNKQDVKKITIGNNERYNQTIDFVEDGCTITNNCIVTTYSSLDNPFSSNCRFMKIFRSSQNKLLMTQEQMKVFKKIIEEMNGLV